MSQKNNMCESCLLPLSKDPKVSGSDTYCSYCYKDGDLIYKGTDVKEFQAHAYQGMREKGMGEYQAKFFTWLIKFAPRWKK